MTKENLSIEEKLNAARQYQEGLKQAKEELFSLFKSGVPLGVFNDIFDDDQNFQGISDNWGNAIDSFRNKYADYIYDIHLRWLITDFLERLPKSKKVYLVHDIIYEYEAWVVGNLESAQLCLKGLVGMHRLSAYFSSRYAGEDTEEDTESIINGYEIEKVTAEVLKKRNGFHHIKKSSLNEVAKDVLCMNDIHDKLDLARRCNLIPEGCWFCMHERSFIDKNTPFCPKSLNFGNYDLIHLRPFTYLQDGTLYSDPLWPAECREFIETLAVAVNTRGALLDRLKILLQEEGEPQLIPHLLKEVENQEQGNELKPIMNGFYRLLVDRKD